MNGCFLHPVGEAACLPLQWVIKKKTPPHVQPSANELTRGNAGGLTPLGCHRWARSEGGAVTGDDDRWR